MGSKASLMLQDDEIEQISKETGFSPIQVEKLYSRFAHLDRNNCGSLSREDFLSIPELAINPLCDRLLHMFFAEGGDDGRINLRQFMRVLANFSASQNRGQNNYNHSVLEKGRNSIGTLNGVDSDTAVLENLDKRLYFIFKVYDADNDGRISFDDLRNVIKLMVGNYIEDVQLDKIATRAFVEVDEDNDGFIDFQEFCKVFGGRNLEDKLRVKFFN